MGRGVFTALAFLTGLSASAQDFHVTQILQSSNLLNPGAVGVYDGWERIAIQQRNQWLGGGATYMTTGLAADANFFKNDRKPKAHLGVGVQFYNDIAGSSGYGLQTGSLAVSGILPVGNGSQLSLGIQGGIGNRSGNMSRLIYDSQWNGNGAYDPTIVSGETGSLSSFIYIDASAGLFYQFDGGQSTFARNNDMKFQVGLAGYHLNAPLLKYRSGSQEQLARKYVGMVKYSMDIPNTKLAFDAQFAQFIQGGHFESILGLILRRRFESGGKITGLNQDAFVGLGVYTRLKDAISPTLQVDWKGFHFGVSYDITLSALRYGYKGGSLEFSLSYTNLNTALFKTRRKGFR
ncbi:PorP/SprF family type IX secretion system membrane protein [Fluviicola taffensis]|uniref:PorP/SprF family type IX secretion system membrane protein n=1 Tax=Fluviicola taffensis TaxID=191579 RepID=UPI0031379CA4